MDLRCFCPAPSRDDRGVSFPICSHNTSCQADDPVVNKQFARFYIVTRTPRSRNPHSSSISSVSRPNGYTSPGPHRSHPLGPSSKRIKHSLMPSSGHELIGSSSTSLHPKLSSETTSPSFVNSANRSRTSLKNGNTAVDSSSIISISSPRCPHFSGRFCRHNRPTMWIDNSKVDSWFSRMISRES